MYFRSGGVDWNNNAGWLSAGDICTTWNGVSCDANLKANALPLLASNILGNADCSAMTNSADAEACEWVVNPTNHQLDLNYRSYNYLTVSSVGSGVLMSYVLCIWIFLTTLFCFVSYLSFL